MRTALLTATVRMVLACAIGLLAALPARAASDSEVIRGFNLTVFGAEYSPFGYQSDYIRKFAGTVSFYIDNQSKRDRRGEVRSFIRSADAAIRGLSTRIVASESAANFVVHVVDRRDYERVVREKLYRGAEARALGKCHVRTIFSRSGIRRSDAVIVSDDGEALFNRCLAEEILQGLGPLNESATLPESMFNDRSRHTRFTRFDRLILNMLYDPRIRIGASRQSVQDLLPQVLRDAKAR
jgi:hypothetical protein